LAISKGLVDASGGSLTATSEGKGLGSTFEIELPTVTIPEGGRLPIALPQHAAPGGNLRILLVEDHRDTASVLADLLTREGYEVRLADSMEEAVRAASEPEAVDVVISDIGLPDGSGLELMQRLGQRKNHLRGIALSGFGSDEDRRRSREAGFDEHLTKPIDFTMLLNAIQHIRPN
ncbi:MAG TPA: response regulator, partial [Tepidisphaeraceae bacterium]